ncbi:hypothetical protein [Chenggangzhangella methanolivorans]|uniref:Uncharacterized protein n=1 Tax=Chenggangzhangella methanolivorans TaxID=1437009 RepID=A0A9E6UL35_9HYPH|nr:hypothetical protein [Chenggangzhangella methanolivorans]QZO00092.1 hypothetical protein K6K41_26635 [Chenggangzhangella methanolivorans]
MRPATILFIAALACAAAAGPSLAQAPSPAAPSQTTPPDKIDPVPVTPEAGASEAPAAGGDRIGVPARVWAMRIAGGWEANGQKGFSRVIGTFEGDRQKLTVQWLAEPDGRVVNAVELNDEEAAKLTFGDMRAEPEDRGGVTMFIDTLRDADGLSDTWVLVIGEPGDARFGPATN